MADIIFFSLIIVGSIFFFFQALSLPTVKGYEKIGAGFWPGFALIGMISVAVVLVILSIMHHKKGDPVKTTPVTMSFWLVGGGMFLYIFLIPYLGFILASILAMICFISMLGEKNKLLTFFTSIGIVAMIYLLFAKIMITPLPRGVSIFRELSYYLY